MGTAPPQTYMEKSEEFGVNNNLFMIFHYENDNITRFGYVITERAFVAFVGSNQETGTRLIEESVDFPPIFIGGMTRQALVHYLPDGKRFACYVPVFPTKAELDNYNAAFGH